MATKIGDLFFEVSANTLKLDKTIAGIGSSAKGAGGIISEAIGGSFVAAGVAATTALAGIVTGIAAVGAASNAASQRATGLFTALTGSAEEAVALMREFAQISLDTPIFSAKALQDVSRTLLAYGVAKDDVVDMAVAIQSAATALGVGELGAQKLALALGQVKSRGFFSAEEARQLANYGINAYGLIAEAVGKTTSEVRQLGAEHRLLSDDVLPILTDKLQTTFGPVAENLINTFGVQVQGLKNTFIGFASALAEPFIGRTGGGAVVEFLQAIRAELNGVVTVGQDGTFQLTGALSGLNDITQELADGFLSLGYSIIDTFKSFGGGGGISSFADTVADAIPKLVEATKAFASGTISFFQELIAAAQPVYEPIKNLVLLLGDFVANALPAAADAVVNFVAAVAPVSATLIQITDLLLKFASPIVVGVIEDLASAFGDLADAAEFLGGPLTLIYGVLGSIAYLATAYGGLGVLAVQGLALAFGKLAAQVVLALGAIAAYKAVVAGLKGVGGNENARDDFLYGDASNPIEGVFQGAARFGRGLTAGSATVMFENQIHDLEEMNEAAKTVGKEFADSFKHSGLTVQEFAEQLDMAKLSTYEAAYATQEYRKILADTAADNHAKRLAQGLLDFEDIAKQAFLSASNATHSLTDTQEDEIDILKELKEAAKDAADALADFLKPTATATVDNFLLGLVESTKKVTEALKEQEDHPGILADLGVTGAENAVRDQAQKIISTLVKTYGLGLDQIKSLLGSEGLLDTIVALGSVTEETTKKVDPLIAKYGQLGATADELKDAIAKLNDQRQTAIKAQIDQVEAALRDAKDTAVEARQAITDFFNGGKGSNTQKLIDTLIGNVGDIGSKIEAGLLDGGEEGAAAIRLALGDVRSALGDIVSSGLEDGLSGQEIVNMLGPIGSVLQEQAQDALNRISSLDWTEGFTPAAGAEISRLLGTLLDPQAIQKLLSDAMGADASVSGLEKQLEELHAAAELDVVFTPAQVQGALDQVSEETTVTVSEIVTTPEAAAAVLHAIQDILLDPTSELKTLIDRDLISKQVLDAAEEGAKQTHLVFDSTLAFDAAGLSQSAQDAATTFITEFNAAQSAILDQYAQSQGFKDYPSMQAALGAGVAGAMAPNVPYIPTVNVNLSQDVTMDGVAAPPISSTNLVTANATGSTTNGRVSRSLQEIYGTVVVPGLRGPQ